MTLQQAAKKVNVDLEQARQMVLMDHYLSVLCPKKQLRSINLKLTNEAIRTVKRVSKVLGVSVDAVVSVLCLSYLEARRGATQNN